MVEDAVEAIGFGKFQWKLSVLTGLAWASISGGTDLTFSLQETFMLHNGVSMIYKEGRSSLHIEPLLESTRFLPSDLPW